MKIFLVNLDFPPVSGPGVWRIMALAKYAAKRGHDVTVICSDRASWHDRMDVALLDQIPDTVKVVRLKSIFLRDLDNWLFSRWKTSNSPRIKHQLANLRWLLKRYWPDSAIHWSLKAAFTTWRLARMERPDCVVSTGPNHLAHLSGYMVRTIVGTPWIMDYRDPWTGFSNDTQIVSGPYQERVFCAIENRLLKKANAVTVVSPSWLGRLRSQVESERDKFSLIRNGHDLAEPLVSVKSSTKTNPHQLCIHFNGTVQPGASLLAELGEAVATLVGTSIEKDSLRISFCGLPKSFMESIRNSPAADCFIDLGPLSHAESLARCIEADALLVWVCGGGEIQMGTIPGKTYEAMALGAHVLGLTPEDSDARDLLLEYGNVTTSRGTNVEDIREALMHLLARFRQDGYTLPCAPESTRRMIAEKYSRAAQSDQYLELCKRVIRSTPLTTLSKKS